MPPGEEKRRTVPKFTSFKPPAPAEPETRPGDSREARKGREEKDVGSESKHRHSKRHHDADRETNRDRKSRPRSSSDRPRDVTLGKDGRQTPGPVGSGGGSHNDLFFFDVRGDPLITKYGGNDRYKVPTYHRFGGGKLMGSDGILSVHYAGSRELFDIEKRHRESKSIFRDKAALARAASCKAKRIAPSSDPPQPTNDDYIEVEPPKKRRRGDQDSSLGFSMPDYRSIHGKAKAGQQSESENESEGSAESDDEGGPAELSATKTLSIEINRRLKAQPGDIASWLELIKLQDSLFREDQGLTDVRSADAVKALASLKLSLYEEALPHAKSLSDRESVLDGLMREGAKVWSPKALAKRWDEVSEKESDSFVLWRARLNFELGQVSTCTYEDIKKLIVEEVQSMNGKLAAASPEDIQSVSGQQIYIFLRLTRFLHDSGYVELAVAAWQATLELTLFRPPSEQAFESAVSSFTDYWETESPRLGEDGWKDGWRRFVESGAIEDLPDARSENPYEIIQSRDVFKAWAAAEIQETRRASMPSRTLDESTLDDPFKVVMFSDIKDLLIWIPTIAIPCATPRLLDAFLTFCQLPTAGLSRNDKEFSRLLQDPFVACRNHVVEAAFNDRKGVSEGPVAEQSKTNPEFRQQGAGMALSQDVLFARPNWFQYLGDWSNTKPLGFDDGIKPAWILGTLKVIVQHYGNLMEELAEYHLALEWRHDPNRASKAAKGLLKDSPTSMRLYNAYALTEWANQNIQMLEKVLSSATGRNLAGEQRLWNTWAWYHLELQQRQMALSRICASADDTTKHKQAPNVTPIVLLRTRTRLSTTRDYSLSSRDLVKATQYAESLALFEYLVCEDESGTVASDSQGSISAALASIWGFCDELKSLNTSDSAYYYECLLQTAARLLYYHATHGAYRPAYLRAELAKLIEAFPHNAIFLELFAWANQSTMFLLVNDPIREVLRRSSDNTGNDDAAVQLNIHRFSIRYEAARGSSAGATMMYPTKAAFEAALGINSNPCGGERRGNVDLWVCYLRLLQSIYKSAAAAASAPIKGKDKGCPEGGNPLVKDVKDVYYRAIASCPWSKRLYMEAFGEGMIKMMASSELRGVVNTMVEKGLRVHVEMAGFCERWEAVRGKKK
ncbi:NRDE-2, necessary for RNA interference-domain-containing protein [Rhypophila decipiens]|uniref:NRDE-2, necessary for RNA interference-domain-containing protein n=1 Tax=Rhypophila decipiens TaxID=261697 RepID=A0AAN7BD68_9PEZI|nr:NRDE-2, necessary for RNA interference-domain-containing protein [Rhypophila decipiens]